MFDIFEYLNIIRILQNDPLKQSWESGFLIKLCSYLYAQTTRYHKHHENVLIY